MKNTLRIFFTDVNSIARHFFAAVIVVAICIIPALYAWFNIYANHDPYGNTGNISVAVASEDAGYNGVNKGEDILDSLRENTGINWVFPENADAAIDGVKSGKYYAAVVIGENFSRNMYDLKSALSDGAHSITYYENGKKNAVANKITETAAETVKQNVQTEYLRVLFETVLTGTDEFGESVDSAQTLDALLGQLAQLSSSLRSYADATGSFVSDSSSLSYVLSGVGGSASGISEQLKNSTGIDSVQAAISSAQSSVSALGEGVDAKLAEIVTALDKASEAIGQLASSDAIQGSMDYRNELVDKAANAVSELQAQLEALRSAIGHSSALSGASYVTQTLDALIARCELLQQQISLLYNNTNYAQDAADIVAACADTVELMRSLISDELTAGTEQMLKNLNSTLGLLGPLVDSLSITLDDIAPVVSSAGDTLAYVSASLTRLQSVLLKAADAVDSVVAEIESGADDYRVQTLLTVLSGNAEVYSEFLSSPVSVVSETIYPVASYGDAMTPFYSVLAVWVGGVILVAIIRVEAEPRGLSRVTERQKFWGRFLLFFLLGQVQAAVIILGDIYLLGCQCSDPFLFWLAGSVTSFVFISLIYSLTLSFGDIGKAIVVVIMVVQIAGSSGSYPIELLPSIFSDIYLFFPFPYAINAMRETICGMYGWDYWVYLAELMIFGVLGLLIGLVVRKPFIKLNRFVELEMDKTGVL